jgi:YlmC/YmxH family sporulation protein
MMKTSQLQVKDVINISDGKRLGWMRDIEVDLQNGRVAAIIVPRPGGLLGLFGRSNDYVIPWERIFRVGEDVILVELDDYAEINSPR